MKTALDLTRKLYYRRREGLFIINKGYNTLKRPKWMDIKTDKRFDSTYTDQKLLFKKGRIMIGKIVQANTLLFEPGKFDHPAAMVFTEDPYFEENPHKLEEIASSLYKIKGRSTNDEELQKFSDMLEDEIVTLFNVEVPKKITHGKKVYFTSFMVHRRHLKLGYMDSGIFPVLALPEKTEASIILPNRYWADELKDDL